MISESLTKVMKISSLPAVGFPRPRTTKLSCLLALSLLLGPASVLTSAPWNPTGSLATVRREHTATLLPNGKVLVAGGFDGSNSLSSAEL